MSSNLTDADTRALFAETLNAGALLEHGIAALERAYLDREDEFLPLTLLASGIERLCKATLWINAFSQGQRLTRDYMRDTLGHRVDSLVQRVTQECFPPSYLYHDVARGDRAFLATNGRLNELLGLITYYAQQDGRYYFLNVLAGEPPPGRNPHGEWLQWDQRLAADNPELELLATTEGGYKYYYAVSIERRKMVERFLRAICRLYAPAVLDARIVCAPPLIRWAELPDTALGSCDYNLLTRHRYDVFHGFRRESVVAYQRVSLADFPLSLTTSSAAADDVRTTTGESPLNEEL